LRAVDFAGDDVYAEFLMDEVLRGDFEARSEALSKADWMTIAEKRKVENLPSIDGTDRIFLNTATMPLDAIDAQSEAIVAQTNNVIPITSVRTVMGRLSRPKTVDGIDADTLTAGLPDADTAAVKAALSDVQANGGSVATLRALVRSMGSSDA
jgi:hypothetical protein